MDPSELSNKLTTSPTQFPGCCLSLSTPLLTALITLLPKSPTFTLSIGSGTGLLEALLTQHDAETPIEGVEVQSAVNRFLPEERMHTVAGGWGLCARARDAAAWMFVYPRDPALVSKYLDQLADGAVERVLWLGPRYDWADYEGCFAGSVFSEVEVLEDIGVAGYECAVLARRVGL